MLEPPSRLLCVEYNGRLNAGKTKPLLVHAIDEVTNERRRIVLKLMRPEGSAHAGPVSLACELICAVLARRVGLPVSDYAIVRVPRELLGAVSDQETAELLRRNLGLNFGTLFIDGVVTWPPGEKTLPDDFVAGLEDLLGFDQAVMNGDRKASNSNLLWRGPGNWFLIDHSLALHTWLWPGNEHPTFPETEIRQHCSFPALQYQGKAYQRFHDCWARDILTTDLARLRGLIPAEWETEGGQLDGIFAFLGRRSLKFADLIKHLKGIVR